MSEVVENLIEAVREGNLQRATTLIDSHGLSFSPELSNGFALLRIAVDGNHAAIVNLLLNKGCSPKVSEAAADNGLLHLAARNGNIKIVELLLNKKADLNGKNKFGETPLVIAVMRGCFPIVELLLKYGAEVNECRAVFDNPLHLAVRNYNFEIAELLLNKGANVNVEDKIFQGQTPLTIAIERGCLPMIELLLKYQADVNECGTGTDSPLILAVRKNNIDVVELLLSNGANVNDKDESDETSLAIAIEKGFLPIVQLLLKYEPDFAMNGAGPLHIATRNCNVEMVELLLNNRIDVNVQNMKGETPLAIAVKKGCVPVTEILLCNGADIDVADKFGRTALHFTVLKNGGRSVDDDDAKSSDTEEDETNSNTSHDIADSADDANDENDGGYMTSALLAVLLLSTGANVNAQTNAGRTALHIATKREIDPLVDLLIGHNASVNLADKKGETALHIAADKGNKGLTTKLLAARADVNALTEHNSTALNLAAENDDKEIVELLLGNGAQVNLKDRDGDAPLHVTKDPEISVNLLEFGAIIDSRSGGGKTALHFRSIMNNKSAVATLLDYGADINLKCDDQKTPLDYTFDDDYRGSDDVTMGEDEARNLLLRHQVKMKAVGLNVVESQGSARYEETLEEFRNSCQGEVRGIENEFIENTNVSYYDILRKDKRFLAKYMDNENVALAAESEEYKSRFPIYASMIKSRFRRGLARNKFFKQASQVFNSFIDLPDVCAEKVLDYLDDEDLAVLTDFSKIALLLE